MSALAFGVLSQVRDTPRNPDNAVGRLAFATVAAQLRPEVRATLFSEKLRLIVRPRFWANLSDSYVRGGYQTSSIGAITVDALYAQIYLHPTLSVAYGRQTFEWGPAQFINASNRLFHINATQRTAVLSVIGKELLRINWSYGTNISAVLVAELRNNGEPIYGPLPFDKKALLKLEYASDSGADYIGVVGGSGTLTPPWLGLYAATELENGFAFYTDTSLAFGSLALHPVRSDDPTAPIKFSAINDDPARPIILGILGAKYTMLNGLQFGFEWIINTGGYNHSEMKDAFAAVRIPGSSASSLAANQLALANPGLEVLGQQQLYFSLLGPRLNLGWETNFSLGYLQSLADGSGRALLYVDASIGTQTSVFLNVLLAHGPAYAEHAAYSYGNVLAGTRFSF